MSHPNKLISILVSTIHFALAIIIGFVIVVVKDPVVLASLFVIFSFAFLSLVNFKNCMTQLDGNRNLMTFGYLQFVDEITDFETSLPLHVFVFGLGIIIIKYCVLVTMQSLKK